MDPQNNLKQLQDLFAQAREILVITKETPSIDGLCAGLALQQALSQKMDMQGKKKRVTMAVSKRNGTQYSLLPGSDQIVSELGLRDLVIGINGFVEGSIENVNWYVDKGRLNVVFKSNPAVPMQFELKNLDPFYAGANFDIVIVIDANSPQELGNAYKQDPGMYSELPVINISNNPNNTRFGRVNIVDPSVPSVSELAYQLGQIAQLNVTGDSATLLLTGIATATDNFARKGQTTDTIVGQLKAYGAQQLDIESIKNQATLPPLPVHKNPPPVAAGNPGMPMGMNTQFPPAYGQYPGQPQYPYMPQPGQYGQYPMPPMGGYYPGQYPQQPMPPGYVPQGYPQQPPMPPQYQPQPEMPPQPVVQEWEQPQEVLQDYVESVPSIEHDLTQSDTYIPTVEPVSYDHVEPSVYMPGIQQDPNIYQQQEYQWQSQTQNPLPQPPDALIEERKEQKNPPDFNSPPPGFMPGEKKF